MNKIRVTVIIPTHNRQDKLVDTLIALRRQTLSGSEYEILVMDDGSTPPVTLQGEKQNPTCRVIRLENVERSAARNTGAALARGSMLVFLDDDIEVKEDFLAAHLQAQQEWPRSFVVGSIRLPSAALQTPFGRFRQQLELTGLPAKRGLVEMQNFCTAANLSIDRDLYFELGGFSTALRSGEDQELALRHSARGGRIVFLPEAEVVHYDRSLDIQSYCQRVAWGSEHIIPFCQVRPDWPANIERWRCNGFLSLGKEPFSLSFRKIMKTLGGQKLVLKPLFRITGIIEQAWPESKLLTHLYRFLLGVHLQKGFRSGLQLHSATQSEQPLLAMARKNV
jgi:GT2 family glycosyltransferase